jgi:hypothetical protein
VCVCVCVCGVHACKGIINKCIREVNVEQNKYLKKHKRDVEATRDAFFSALALISVF